MQISSRFFKIIYFIIIFITAFFFSIYLWLSSNQNYNKAYPASNQSQNITEMSFKENGILWNQKCATNDCNISSNFINTAEPFSFVIDNTSWSELNILKYENNLAGIYLPERLQQKNISN